jgi:uncharacterized protein with PQ loop repeat
VWNNAKQKVAKKKHTPTKKTFKEKVKNTMAEIQKNTALNKTFFAEQNISYVVVSTILISKVKKNKAHSSYLPSIKISRVVFMLQLMI